MLERVIAKAAGAFVKVPSFRTFIQLSEATLECVRRKQAAARLATWIADRGAPLGARLAAQARAKLLGSDAKRATRTEPRARVQDLADQASSAARAGDIRQCYQLINRIAPKPMAATVTVNDAEGRPCMKVQAESDTRKLALVEMLTAAEIDVEARPPTSTDPTTPVSPDQLVASDVDHTLRCDLKDVEGVNFKMPNNKAAPPSRR